MTTSDPTPQGPDRPDLAIDWSVPPPRPGWRGGLDRFFGPGQTRAEVVVQVLGLAVCGGLLGLFLARELPALDLPWWSALLLAVFAFDALGGVLTNATGAAKRWYHRPDSRTERLGFVATHLGHLVVIALLVLPLDWAWLTVNAAVLLVFATLVAFTPLAVQRPVALGLLMAAVALNALLVPLPSALAWIPALFFLKLLVSHLVLEAPFHSGPSAGGASG